jgi:DNA (cytosine-5)-methyltransferase 1
VHDKELSAFLSIDKRQYMTSNHAPPDNCYTSSLIAENKCKATPAQLRDNQRIANGVAFGGHTYHDGDFVLYRSEDGGPAHIGYITKISVIKGTPRRTKICMRRVGRINTILDAMQSDMMKNEVCISI